ncbi:hypothetical protein PHLCEN_2v8214 [Hermanssonia centrifuga]|uniref:galacturonan 1,4-alpha-galacturonidase n=1 Tax=Hermanssonia centrifuga TaxID=98765 RepID=A0A2R6NUW7_9APHY|nr:hypothetical protein PHLCEN_2v8214 [Hermanssonia centrifuga]
MMRVFAFILALFLLVGTARSDCEVDVHEPRHPSDTRDDGPAINAAFQKCARGGKVVLDKFYIVDSLLFTTDLHDVEIELSGTIQYTPNIEKWSPDSYFLTYQNATTFWFLSGEKIQMHGGGTIDGNGQVWYDALANSSDTGTAGGSSRTFARPVPLTVGNASHVHIEDITIVNSPFWYAGEVDIVANVTIKDVSMNNAQNGARIKVFGGSSDPASTAGGGSGFVQNITYHDYTVNNVDNPIVIDQCYDTAADVCAQFPSLVTISDVHFINVKGTSSGAEGNVVADLECSSECTDITANGTDIRPPDGAATFTCQNIESTDQLDFNCTAPAS